MYRVPMAANGYWKLYRGWSRGVHRPGVLPPGPNDFGTRGAPDPSAGTSGGKNDRIREDGYAQARPLLAVCP